MTVNFTWVNPSGATIDLAAGALVGETNWDALASDLNKLGGSDGNGHTGPYEIGATAFTNPNMTTGLTVNQAGATNEILALKRVGALAHGMTGITDTDTFLLVKGIDNTNAGADVYGVSGATASLRLRGYGVTDDTTHTTTSRAYVEVFAAKKSGTGIAAPGANACLFAVVDGGGTTQFIIDAEGDMFNNGASGTSTTYDQEDDGALVEAVSTLMNPERELGYKFRLARDLEAHKAALAAGGVITLNPDGSLSMVSHKGLIGLLIDAIRQVTHAHRTLEARVAPLLPA